MRHIVFGESDRYPVALLIKATAFNHYELQKQYVDPLQAQGIDPAGIVALTLTYNEHGKAPVKHIKEQLDEIMPALTSLSTQYIYVADSAFFKVLTKLTKAEPYYGYVLPCKLKGYEHMQVVLGLNHQALIYNPDLQAKLDLSLNTLASHIQGTYQPLGNDIIHSASYPETTVAIQEAVNQLHQYPSLTCDIEAFSLRFYEAGIGTISFAWDEHNGVGFACDYHALPEKDEEGNHGVFVPNPPIRRILRTFFETYQGKLIWHNITYDAKVLIYTLWMRDPLDTPGLLQGLEVMTRLFDDTKIIAYLATNSTAGNVLGLKPLAHHFAGNWAKDDIKDIRKIPLPELLQYNVVDTLSTWYVRNTYHPQMVQDNQEDLYHSLMLPSLKTIIQIELTGMPMEASKIQEAKAELQEEANKHLYVINTSPIVDRFNQIYRQQLWQKDFDSRKAKAKNPDKILPKRIEAFDGEVFNPNSGPQLQQMLYTQLGLPVLDYTDTKLPATGGETLEKLTHHTSDPETLALLNALVDYAGVAKILSAFIPAFEKALPKKDGRVYLHGSFNLGGTVSGRLSSSEPNLQQIPAGSQYGKLIKTCFSAAPGWIFAGADFSSLEDYISALTTKDPNKLAVYERGFDGHCLRAYAYFKKEMPEIRQAEESERCFAIQVSGQTFMCKSGDFVIMPDGTKQPVEAYFETHS